MVSLSIDKSDTGLEVGLTYFYSLFMTLRLYDCIVLFQIF